MGDMADMLIEQMEEDALWSAGSPISGPRPKPICRYCGKKNLRWKQVGERWLLFENKQPHNCPKCPLSLETLKKLAESGKIEYLAKKRERNLHSSLTKKGIENLICHGIKTTELLDLFEDLIRRSVSGEKLALIREEILRRLK